MMLKVKKKNNNVGGSTFKNSCLNLCRMLVISRILLEPFDYFEFAAGPHPIGTGAARLVESAIHAACG